MIRNSKLSAGDLYKEGNKYSFGNNGLQKDFKKAVEFYKQAVQQGHAGAQFNLGFCYYNGQGVAQDYQEAVRLYRLAAEQGDAWGQISLGLCYQNGQGVAQDYQEAVRLYRLAAEQGDACGQANLGFCYEKGQGVAQDYREAVRLYRLSAEQGNARAQANLGLCYKGGQGVAQDYQEAVRLFRFSAEQGNAGGQNNLGLCYDNGQGVAQDYQEAVRLYRLSAEQGYAGAQFNLGFCYENGQGVAQDYQEAVRLYRLAAEQGHAWGQAYLADCYEKGLGVEKELGRAIPLYVKAARQGNDFAKKALLRLAKSEAEAQVSLGMCYKAGTGFEKDVKKAFEYYEMAAKQGDKDGQFYVGQCYEKGIGVAKSLEKADSFYQLASKQGHALAKEKIRRRTALKQSPKKHPVQEKVSFEIPYTELTLGAKLGEGGYGTVYKGQWHYNEVAIKTLNSKRLSQDSLAELQAEAHIMAQIKSDYIITLRGICVQNPYAIVMELMPQGSLNQLLHNRQNLPWSIRYSIGKDIGFGLQQLHDNGIIHRDLKSLNVLLGYGFRAKICDFGLSKLKTQIGSESQSKTHIGGSGDGAAGTILWKAPELFQRKAKHTRQSDTYSYGMVLWELASRRYPYSEEESQSLVPQYIKDWDYEDIPEDCPKQFGEMITACWGEKRKPESRTKPAQVAQKLLILFEQNRTQTPGLSNMASLTSSLASPSAQSGRNPASSISSEFSGYQVATLPGEMASGYQNRSQ